MSATPGDASIRGILTEDEKRDQYEWDDDLTFSNGDTCKRCGGPITRWTEYVPCCGHPYTCTDALYCYACDACRVMGDTF